ncbi:hypothetical protein BST61_g637 [Cercospora zeina]
MNFYPPSDTLQTELYIRIPDELRCIGQETEWRGGSTRAFQWIFLEGPVFDRVDIPYGRVLKISRAKEVTVCAKWDGEPNGLAAMADGTLIGADCKQGNMSINLLSGKVTPRLSRRNLERFKGSNDLIVDSQNNIYFTVQGQTGMTDPTGKVYRLSPTGKLDTLIDNGPSPNGLVLSPDEKVLFVAMTRANQVWRLPLHDDGTTTKVGVFFQSFGTAGPDGLAMDQDGNLFICHPSLGAVFVVEPTGIPKARLTSDSRNFNPTNCCFGGEENRTLFITDSMEGCVRFVEWYCPGATLAPRLCWNDDDAQ